MIANIDELYEALKEVMDDKKWWNTDNLWEIMIGAILVQNTNWRNVDYSLQNIQSEVGFLPEKILLLEDQELEKLIRPSGFYKNKSQTIKRLLKWLKAYDFDLEAVAAIDSSKLRKLLLEIKGIGYETADVLLVYVFKKSAFIADKYAQRLFQCLGIEEHLNYQKLQNMIPWSETYTSEAAQNFHGWIVDYGQQYLKNKELWKTGPLSTFTLKII
ncbi:deoxyribonuclease I [Enterococcus sp. LJL128]